VKIMSAPNAFDWKDAPSIFTLPENYRFQTRKYKQWIAARRANPDTTPDWETYRDRVEPKAQHCRTKKERVIGSLKSPKERADERKAKLLALRTGAFMPHIPNKSESDRTLAIKGAAC